MQVQSKIPSALVALHNFILKHDEADLDHWLVDNDVHDNLPGMYRNEDIDFGLLATTHIVSNGEKRRAEDTRDKLAQEMWNNYQVYLEEQMDCDDYYHNIEPLDLD
jgi:hypothetical protein